MISKLYLIHIKKKRYFIFIDSMFPSLQLSCKKKKNDKLSENFKKVLFYKLTVVKKKLK